MAVQVYDREGSSWDYERGIEVVFDDLGLQILDASRDVVGGFNHASWTHFSIPLKTP